MADDKVVDEGAGTGGDAGDDSILGKGAEGDATAGKDTPPVDGEGDKKPEDGEPGPTGKDGDDKSADDDDKAKGAPEEGYADFNVPEGVELDKGAIEGFTALAKELDLSQADAQRIIDLDSERMTKVAEQQSKEWEDVQKGFITELKDDKDFGGENFDKNVKFARRVIETFGGENKGEDLKKAFNETGVGNLPVLVKFLAKIGPLISEDTFLAAGAEAPGVGDGGEESDADIMYGKEDKTGT